MASFIKILTGESQSKMVKAAPISGLPFTFPVKFPSVTPSKPTIPVAIPETKPSLPNIESDASTNKYQGNSGIELNDSIPADNSSQLPTALIVGGGIAGVLLLMGTGLEKSLLIGGVAGGATYVLQS